MIDANVVSSAIKQHEDKFHGSTIVYPITGLSVCISRVPVVEPDGTGNEIPPPSNPYPYGCAAASAGYKFRLLTNADTIEKGDEFLSDDCETWSPANEQILAGRGIKYDLYRDVPMRRKL